MIDMIDHLLCAILATVVICSVLAAWSGIGYVVYAVLTHYGIV